MTLPPDQLRRWSRQICLPPVGLEGQEKLAQARVAIVGIGGLGCPAALYLAAAGVGTLGLLDHDEVALSNLQRQILYQEQDIGRSKTEAAADRLRSLRSDLALRPNRVQVAADNAMELLAGYDLVVDGSDNFPARYAVNDACVLLKIPHVHGSVLQFEGRATVFAPGRGPCYRCLYAAPPPTGAVRDCAAAGVMGALCGMIGTIQAAEAIKWICGIGEPLIGRLLVVDMLAMAIDQFNVTRNPNCPLCGDHPAITRPLAHADICTSRDRGAQGGDDYDLDARITPRVAKRRLDAGEQIIILDVREPVEFALSRLSQALLMPLADLPARGEIELGAQREREIVVMCHYGIRSVGAVDWLRRHGFKRVKNLDGGIDRWSVEADPSIPRY